MGDWKDSTPAPRITRDRLALTAPSAHPSRLLRKQQSPGSAPPAPQNLGGHDPGSPPPALEGTPASGQPSATYFMDWIGFLKISKYPVSPSPQHSIESEIPIHCLLG